MRIGVLYDMEWSDSVDDDEDDDDDVIDGDCDEDGVIM